MLSSGIPAGDYQWTSAQKLRRIRNEAFDQGYADCQWDADEGVNA
jgi:hypothetical protein